MRCRGPMFRLRSFAARHFCSYGKQLRYSAFSRQYQTSCTTCHVDFPKPNDSARAFKDAGFKFPKDDESFRKVPPVMLGAPRRRNFGLTRCSQERFRVAPIGLRFNTCFQSTSASASAHARRDRRRADVGAHGTRARDSLAFSWRETWVAICVLGGFRSERWGDRNSSGGLGDGYLKFVNIGRFLKLPTDSLSLWVGQFDLGLPFPRARSINLSGWDIYAQANMGFAGTQNVNNVFAIQDAAQGSSSVEDINMVATITLLQL